jgi:hypothetical protein
MNYAPVKANQVAKYFLRMIGATSLGLLLTTMKPAGKAFRATMDSKNGY